MHRKVAECQMKASLFGLKSVCAAKRIAADIARL